MIFGDRVDGMTKAVVVVVVVSAAAAAVMARIVRLFQNNDTIFAVRLEVVVWTMPVASGDVRMRGVFWCDLSRYFFGTMVDVFQTVMSSRTLDHFADVYHDVKFTPYLKYH